MLLGLGGAVAVPSAASALSPVTYFVFFDYGQAKLSPRAEETIAAFAKAYRDLDKHQVVLRAHTDSSEASEALSRARGEAVRKRLAELGVPVERVLIFPYGDTQPLVLTGPNVREPNNRRVELAFAYFSRQR